MCSHPLIIAVVSAVSLEPRPLRKDGESTIQTFEQETPTTAIFWSLDARKKHIAAKSLKPRHTQDLRTGKPLGVLAAPAESQELYLQLPAHDAPNDGWGQQIGAQGMWDLGREWCANGDHKVDSKYM